VVAYIAGAVGYGGWAPQRQAQVMRVAIVGTVARDGVCAKLASAEAAALPPCTRQPRKGFRHGKASQMTGED